MTLNAGSSRQLATVLVVDADAIFREFEAKTLSDRGYDVLKASGTEEALRLVRQSPNISLLLHGSPIHEPDTLEFTRQFRKTHPGAPVLLLLWSLEGLDETFNSLGRVGMMSKPFELIQLVNNVQRLLAKVHQPAVDSHRGETLRRAVVATSRTSCRGRQKTAVSSVQSAKRIKNPFVRVA